MAVIRQFDRKKRGEENTEDLIIKIVKERQKADGGHDESNWLISYADMMTLLCMFFVMLFTLNQKEDSTEKREHLKQQIAEELNVEYKSPAQDIKEFINNVLVESGVEKDAMLSTDGNSVSISFHSTMFFDTLSAELRPEGNALLQKLVQQISDRQKQHSAHYKIVIEGHTDSQPILGGSFASNWELSSARASRVIRLFTESDFKPDNLLAIGYADTRPVAESRNPDGSWNLENLAKNRRVVVRVLMPDVDSIPWKSESHAIPSQAPETAQAPAAEAEPAPAPAQESPREPASEDGAVNVEPVVNEARHG